MAMLRSEKNQVWYNDSFTMANGLKVTVECHYDKGQQTMKYIRFGEMPGAVKTDMDLIKSMADALKALWPLT